jgi:hypothetical protein
MEKQNLLNQIGMVLLGVYGFLVGLYDLYFSYQFIVEPDKQSHFVSCMFNLIWYALYGWIWCMIKALASPYWLYIDFIK